MTPCVRDANYAPRYNATLRQLELLPPLLGSTCASNNTSNSMHGNATRDLANVLGIFTDSALAGRAWMSGAVRGRMDTHCMQCRQNTGGCVPGRTSVSHCQGAQGLVRRAAGTTGQGAHLEGVDVEHHQRRGPTARDGDVGQNARQRLSCGDLPLVLHLHSDAPWGMPLFALSCHSVAMSCSCAALQPTLQQWHGARQPRCLPWACTQTHGT